VHYNILTYLLISIAGLHIAGATTAVLLAQFRIGLCHELAAYHNVIDPTIDPICTKCRLMTGSRTLNTAMNNHTTMTTRYSLGVCGWQKMTLVQFLVLQKKCGFPFSFGFTKLTAVSVFRFSFFALCV